MSNLVSPQSIFLLQWSEILQRFNLPEHFNTRSKFFWWVNKASKYQKYTFPVGTGYLCRWYIIMSCIPATWDFIPWEYNKREVFFHRQQEYDGRNPLMLYHHTLFVANVLQNKTLPCVSVGPRHENSHEIQNIHYICLNVYCEHYCQKYHTRGESNTLYYTGHRHWTWFTWSSHSQAALWSVILKHS